MQQVRSSLIATAALVSTTLAVVLASAAPAASAGSLSVRATTTPAGGNYAPRNVTAVWIEDSTGAFVKTISRWANQRRQHLVAWQTAAGTADVDAISGATRQDHAAPLMITWDMKNRTGAEVPDGTYRVRMEVADRNSNMATQNNQGTFTFTKGPAGFTQTSSNGGFNNVTITYTAAAPTCNNGAVEAGETCDPPGSCPTSCAVSADACAPNVLVGSATSCTAACVTRAISDCAGGDGCCPASCTAATDSDCAAPGDGADEELSGGCQVSSSTGAGLWLFALGLVLLARRRR